MKQNQDDLREKLKEVREEYGTTYSFIAKEMGVARATISLFVASKRGMSLTNEIKLKQLLKTTFPKK